MNSTTSPSQFQTPIPTPIPKKKIFRFKFSEHITILLDEFSATNREKDRKAFKQQWKKCTEENHEEIQKEIIRIVSLGYEGDVLEKMFCSTRYYHRKKNSSGYSSVDENGEPVEIPAPKKERKKYETISKNILQHIDKHIVEQLKIGSSPSIAFESYWNTINHGDGDVDDIFEKIKKRYKNRYQIKSNCIC